MQKVQKTHSHHIHTTRQESVELFSSDSQEKAMFGCRWPFVRKDTQHKKVNLFKSRLRAKQVPWVHLRCWKGYLGYKLDRQPGNDSASHRLLLAMLVRIEHENDRRKGKKVGADNLCLQYLIFKMTGQIYRRRLGTGLRKKYLNLVLRKLSLL